MGIELDYKYKGAASCKEGYLSTAQIKRVHEHFNFIVENGRKLGLDLHISLQKDELPMKIGPFTIPGLKNPVSKGFSIQANTKEEVNEGCKQMAADVWNSENEYILELAK